MGEEPDFVPLARAASLAHARLFPGESVRDTKMLDLLALALSAHVRLYQRDLEGKALRGLGEADIAGGRFTRGATRLEFAERPPLRFLVVLRRDLAAAIDAVAKDGAAISLLAARSRPRPPASSSAPGA